jgi:hypothetical protein
VTGGTCSAPPPSAGCAANAAAAALAAKAACRAACSASSAAASRGFGGCGTLPAPACCWSLLLLVGSCGSCGSFTAAGAMSSSKAADSGG